MGLPTRTRGIAAAALAVVIWSSLASLSVSLRDLPVLQLTGMALFIGGLLSLPWANQWTADWKAILLGCYGLFLYHLLFILALRWAPPIQANLVHYLWPTLIVVLAPVFLKNIKLGAVHFGAAAAGFLGAALAIMSTGQADTHWRSGYLFALAAAIVWSSYSLLLRRVHSAGPAMTGLCCLISGAMSLGVQQVALDPLVSLSYSQWVTVIALGVGPMGGAFYLWNFALKTSDPRAIGVLANATPVLSTIALTIVVGQQFAPILALSVALIVASSALVLGQT